MKASFAVVALISAIVAASPVAKTQVGNTFENCSALLCPLASCGESTLQACLCQNAVELSCQQKCPSYTPRTQICKRQYGASNDRYGAGYDSTSQRSQPVAESPNWKDAWEEDGSDGGKGNVAENEYGADGNGNISEDSDTGSNHPVNNGPDSTSNDSLINTDVNVLPSAQQNHGNPHLNGQGGSLINADINLLPGNQPNNKVHQQGEAGGSLINVDVDVLPGGQQINDNQQQDGAQGYLNDIDVEISRLLDLRVEFLSNSNQRQDDRNDSLVRIDLEIRRLLDLHVGVLRRQAPVTTPTPRPTPTIFRRQVFVAMTTPIPKPTRL